MSVVDQFLCTLGFHGRSRLSVEFGFINGAERATHIVDTCIICKRSHKESLR